MLPETASELIMNARSTYFGQEFPSTFPQRERKKERTCRLEQKREGIAA
jgi:hypothetical protein